MAFAVLEVGIASVGTVPTRHAGVRAPQWSACLKGSYLVDFYYRLEHLRGQSDAARLQAIVELRPDAGGAETSAHSSVFHDPRLLEKENVLQRDDVLLHAHHFRDMGDAARSIAETRRLNEQIDGGGDLRADRADAHIRVDHTHHHLQAAQPVARAVSRPRGQPSILPPAQCL